MSAPPRHAADPSVLAGTSGLVHFLRELVQSRHQRQRDDRTTRQQERVWLANLPGALPGVRPRADGVLLTLDHVTQSAPPEIPATLEGWIDPARCLDPDAGDPPLAHEGPGTVTLPAGESALVGYDGEGTGDTIIPRAEAGAALRAYGPWRQRWCAWAERERRERPLRDLYEQVYAWHRRLALEDDSVELVLGIGLLAWERPGRESVHRHLLTQRMETSFDRRTAQVTVRLSPDSALRLEDRDSSMATTAGCENRPRLCPRRSPPMCSTPSIPRWWSCYRAGRSGPCGSGFCSAPNGSCRSRWTRWPDSRKRPP